MHMSVNFMYIYVYLCIFYVYCLHIELSSVEFNRIEWLERGRRRRGGEAKSRKFEKEIAQGSAFSYSKSIDLNKFWNLADGWSTMGVFAGL